MKNLLCRFSIVLLFALALSSNASAFTEIFGLIYATEVREGAKMQVKISYGVSSSGEDQTLIMARPLGEASAWERMGVVTGKFKSLPYNFVISEKQHLLKNRDIEYIKLKRPQDLWISGANDISVETYDRKGTWTAFNAQAVEDFLRKKDPGMIARAIKQQNTFGLPLKGDSWTKARATGIIDPAAEGIEAPLAADSKAAEEGGVRELNGTLQVTEGKNTFVVKESNQEIIVSTQDGKLKVSYPLQERAGLRAKSVRVVDGLLHVDGAERIIDLREFKGEVYLIGDTEPVKEFLDGEKKPYPIRETVEMAAPDLVAEEREAIRLGKSIVLEETDTTTSRKVMGTLFLNRSARIVGSPGSGKTAEIEIFAKRVAAGKEKGIPRTLQIRKLSLSSLETGTEYVGLAASRAEALLRYAAANRAVYMVDEFHQIVGIGTSKGRPSGLMEQVKPPLERGKIRIIAISTTTEWENAFSSNPAFYERFDEVVHESPKDQKELLRRIRNSFRLARQPVPSDKVILEAIDLSDRFAITGSQPRKSVNLIKKAYSILAQAGNFGKVPTVKDIRSAALESYHLDPVYLDTAKVNQMVLELGEKMREKVVGQTEAILAVENIFLRKAAGVGSSGVANAMGFYGPPGTGKTLTSKLAGSQMKMHVELISMNGFSRADIDAFRYRVYQGLRKSPQTVIILDELNRAPIEVQNAVLEMLSEAKFIVDFEPPAGGHVFEEVNCRNALFVWTTNAGQELLTGDASQAATVARSGMGFQLGAAQGSEEAKAAAARTGEISRAQVEEALVEGGISEPLISRTQIIVGMSRPDETQFREQLGRALREALARESARHGIELRLPDQEKYLDELMKVYVPQETDYRVVDSILKSELDPWISRALIDPKAGSSRRIVIEWKPGYVVEHKQLCQYLVRHKNNRPLNELRKRD